MTPENMCHMTPTPPLPPHGHYPNMHRDMYMKPEPMISQYPMGPAASGSGDMQQTQMLHQLLQHPQGQEWVKKYSGGMEEGRKGYIWMEIEETSSNMYTFFSHSGIPVHQAKKRKHSDSPNSTLNSQILTGIIKQEPGRQASFCSSSPPLPHAHLLVPTLTLKNRTALNIPNMLWLYLNCWYFKLFVTGLMQDADSSYLDPNYQCIKWQPHQQNKWTPLYDANCKELWVEFILAHLYIWGLYSGI